MRDLPLIAGFALAGALAVAVPGALVLRLLRRRSVTVHVLGLLTVTVAAALAGVLAVAQAMFISPHDLQVLLAVLAAAGVVSLAIGWWSGRRLARDAVWADQVRERERQVEAGRRELVAWVSHDLRTPLAGLRAMAEALEDRVVADPDTVHEYHRRLRVEADRMAQLVDDLFELSRIHADALHLTLSAVPLGDLVSDAIASAEPVAAAHGVRVVATEPSWPAVTGSEPELGRVIANLLRNAIHYTPHDGTVVVSAGRDRDTAWLAVADGCGGIPEADLPRVFDVAFRGEPARSPRSRGNGGAGGGLGLAIVRGLVEAQGGRVDVANSGTGCRFVVRLPAVAARG
ncbi:MAG: sensor histidine kinase [Micromonosporaceae bacterium]|nr:sensor histidine kinase [Micromonosporaceae bacterium]